MEHFKLFKRRRQFKYYCNFAISFLDRKRIRLLAVLAIVGIFFINVSSRVLNANEKHLSRPSRSSEAIHVEPIDDLQLTKEGPCSQLNALEHKFISYCSCDADRRGLNQNVIAYSLYGNFSNERHFTRYVDPIKIILTNISQVYPGWIVRIYSALEPGYRVGNLKLKEIFEQYPFVDLCNATRVLEVRNITRPLFPMTWRFLPLMDPTVDRLLPRDSDSLITVREVEAVRQWLTESKATFHMMRDHMHHCSTDILGGFWGTKLYQNRQAIMSASYKIYYQTEHKMEYGFDQTMLNTFIWPLAVNDSLAHDSYCCEKFKGTKAFPTRREGTEYVAKILHQELNPDPLPVSCPEKCRPPDHPEWTHC